MIKGGKYEKETGKQRKITKIVMKVMKMRKKHEREREVETSAENGKKINKK